MGERVADLRDQFAMAALTGLIANSEAVHAGTEPTTSWLQTDQGRAFVAQQSFAIAHEMMTARQSSPLAGGAGE